MIVLMPGRFQPFHRGHFGNVVKILAQGHSLKIAIRDVAVDKKKNFWTASIIKQIIDSTLTVEEIQRTETFIVPDICENWAVEVEKVVGKFDSVAAGNPRLKMHFDCAKIHTPRKGSPYSATQVRKQLKSGESLQNMCLASTINVMHNLQLF